MSDEKHDSFELDCAQNVPNVVQQPSLSRTKQLKFVTSGKLTLAQSSLRMGGRHYKLGP